MSWFQLVVTLGCTIGAGFFYYLMDLAPQSPKKLPVKGGGEFRMPDMYFLGTPGTLYAVFDQAGEEGRPRMRRYWYFDFGFILCFLGVMLAVDLNAVGTSYALYPWMNIAAIARAALDMAENCLFLILLRGWPTRKNRIARAACTVTTLKFMMLFAWIGMLFFRLFVTAFHIGA